MRLHDKPLDPTCPAHRRDSAATSTTSPRASSGPSGRCRAKSSGSSPTRIGNSVGHLVLHLTGNLNHYIGAKIAGTGYVRDRPREFTDAAEPPAEWSWPTSTRRSRWSSARIRSLDDDGVHGPRSPTTPIQTRFGLLLVCAAHLNNHIGQMSYLVQAWGTARRSRRSGGARMHGAIAPAAENEASVRRRRPGGRVMTGRMHVPYRRPRHIRGLIQVPEGGPLERG